MTALEYFIDFKSAEAYLSLSPTLKLSDLPDVEIRWRPFQTVQTDIPRERTAESKGDVHRRVRANARRRMNLTYAQRLSVPMSYPAVSGETDHALAALLNGLSAPAAYVEAAFEAYWVHHENLDDTAVVNRLLAATGNKAVYAVQWPPLLMALADAQHAAESQGVINAPGYVVADQLFIGREHLPWIRELLS